MNILFVSAEIPGRSQIRANGFIRALAAHGHRITLVCGNGGRINELSELRRLCHTVVAVPQSQADRRRNLIRALPGPLPQQTALALDRNLLDAVRNEMRSKAHDIAHVNGLSAAALGYGLFGLPAVLDAGCCASLCFEQAARAGAHLVATLLDLGRIRRYEGGYMNSYERVFTASEEDSWALHTLTDEYGVGPARQKPIHVIRTVLDLNAYLPPHAMRSPTAILLRTHHDEPGAAACLAQIAFNVMPIIWRRHADVRLQVAGPLTAAAKAAVNSDPRIVALGGAPDARGLLAQATVALIPNALNNNADQDALEAFAMGTPVVAHPRASRKLHVAHSDGILLAEGHEQIAQSLLQLLDDPTYRGRIGIAGRRYAEEEHSLLIAAADLEQIYSAARGATIADWRLQVGVHRSFQRERAIGS